jgi:hypothetical protein
MSSRLSRRAFLAASAGLVVAGACSGGDDDSVSDTTTTTTPEPDQLSVLIASAQVVAGPERRFAFGVLKDNEPLPGTEAVVLHTGKDFNSLGPGIPATFHSDGIEDRPYWTAQVQFDQPGEYAIAVVSGKQGGGAGLQVLRADQTKVPQPGQPMIAVATPTTADARGVNPICTRQPEPCALHEVSLDTALAEKRPVVALFSTPALCQSRICGPVLDILLEETAAYADRVRFVHVEVYRSLDADLSAASLTDGMRAYSLTFEPVIFFAGADGVIRRQVDGPFDRGELKSWLAELVG